MQCLMPTEFYMPAWKSCDNNGYLFVLTGSFYTCLQSWPLSPTFISWDGDQLSKIPMIKNRMNKKYLICTELPKINLFFYKTVSSEILRKLLISCIEFKMFEVSVQTYIKICCCCFLNEWIKNGFLLQKVSISKFSL